MTQRFRSHRLASHLAACGLLCLVPLATACGRDRSADATPAPPPEDTRPATPEPQDVQPAAPVTSAQSEPSGQPDPSNQLAAAAVTSSAGAPVPAEAQPAPDPTRLAEKQRELDRREAALDAREKTLETPTPRKPAPARSAPAEPAVPQPEAAPETAPAPGPDEALPGDESWRRRPADDRLEGSADDQSAQAPAAAPEPLRTFTLPTGTRLDTELRSSLSSATARAGDEVRARLRQPVVIDGTEVVPAGSEVVGEVTEAVPLGKVGGQARLVLDFRRLEPRGSDPVPIDAEIATKGENETARDAATIGGAAVGGAVLGRVLNRGHKGKGSLIGAIVGAAAGTVIASRSQGEEVVLPAGAQLQLTLNQPADVEVRGTPPPR